MKINDIVAGEEEIGDPIIKMVTLEVIASVPSVQSLDACTETVIVLLRVSLIHICRSCSAQLNVNFRVS